VAKYYYTPLYLAPSMRQPGATPTRSAYAPGLTDPVTGVTTSASRALDLAGVDITTYTTLLPGPGEAKINGQIPGANPSTIPYRSAYDTSIPGAAIPPGVNKQPSWPVGPPFISFTANPWWSNGGMYPTEAMCEPPFYQTRTTRKARTAILYVDTVRRMVIMTPDAFVDGPFIANGWVQKTALEVNTDYPFTVQTGTVNVAPYPRGA